MRQLRLPAQPRHASRMTDVAGAARTCRTGHRLVRPLRTSSRTLQNDYKIDREAQKSKASYTGIPGIRQQDMAVTETMGTIYDRSHEHLGTSDSMIIRTRRRWIAAAKALRRAGRAAAQRRQPADVPPALRRGDPAAQRRLVGRHQAPCASSGQCRSRSPRRFRPPAAAPSPRTEYTANGPSIWTARLFLLRCPRRLRHGG